MRKCPFVHKEGWAPDEATYIHAEKEATLLGWIWGLPCPVINRYPPELWFEPVGSLEFWHGQIDRFDLELVSTRSDQAVPCYPVAVIDSRVVWNEGAPSRLGRINDSLVGFAGSLGLGYIEFRIADTMGKPQVAEVEPFPKYDGFCLSSRREIIRELVDSLTGSKSAGPVRNASDSWF
jgi:1-acyl-sn-glycerol-3-phosphate acyltransferase